jgi:hypothetical protein
LSIFARLAVLSTAGLLAVATRPVLASVDVGPGAIVSTVRDASGKPVAGALVVADGPTVRQATTSVAGVVTLLGLPLGTYAVRVVRSGYTPTSTTVSVGGTAPAIQTVRMALTPASFANLSGATAQQGPAGLNGGVTPNLAPALSSSLQADVVATSSGRGVTATLEGTQPGETRIELDGIPIAGGPAGPALLAARGALQLDRVEFVEGPALPGTSVDGAIGGVINYRTAPISKTQEGGVTFGYDSRFGSFEAARFSDTYGNVGVMANLVDGQGANHSEVLKAQIALSPSTTFLAAAYDSQGTLVQSGTSVANDAPAYAFDVRTTLGTGTLQGRLFDSVSDTALGSNTAASQTDDWRIAGVALGYDVPFGENLARIGFSRQTELATVDGSSLADETLSTLRLGTDLQLSGTSRLELADAIGSGSQLSRRNDPQIALALRPSPSVTLRVAAGSAYATSLDVLGTAAPGGTPPETSFGYRASADASLTDGDHLRVALFALRRFDAFASLSDARAAGAELGYERTPVAGGLGVQATVDLTRTYAFGSQQPAARFIGLPAIDGAQFAQDPFRKARFALAYRTSVSELDFGSTLLGANNALSGRGIVLGDASVRVPLAGFADLRVGVQNLFGEAIADPLLAPLYPPHEFTLSVRSSGAS